ncbi:TPA: hypothetical protein ACGIY5_001472 [Corynebacterium striatum]|uniref:hypothetical protein n=1 Tax=Corynebacterium simulans TaxID=146827 RepID=UPI002004F6B7|nr:hypothetical protein [Corynebacterium simulans]MCK6161550.1 hypothetical protein [Corynebacterium simulans]
MREIDWEKHRAHRQLVAKDRGVWIGLVDQDGVPLMDLPPMTKYTAPATRLSPESASFTMAIKSPRGVVHPMTNHLAGRGIGRVDAQGRLELVADETRFIMVEKYQRPRRDYRVSHTILDGPSPLAPSTAEVHAADTLNWLTGIPAMSAPTTWTGEWKRFTRDWAGPENVGVQFAKPRDLQDIKMVSVADGATVEGPAEETLRRIYSESVEAAFRAAGIDDAPVKVAPAPTGRTSPHVLIRPTDGNLWEETASIAMAAGVRIAADMWWPGDEVPEGLSLDKPTIVITIEQQQEVR